MKRIVTTLAFLFSILLCISSFAQITTASQWTWMKGDNIAEAPGVFGTLGVAAAANKPGARDQSASWTDSAGNLWLFGGYRNTLDAGIYTHFFFNDLWKYSPATNQWTWMKGANTANAPGTYGVMGIASASNTPGARSNAATWTDTAGNFWLFGGHHTIDGGYSTDQTNDLWRYSPTTNQWTWINGSGTPLLQGVYGTQGIANAANIPGSREGSATWTDTAGNFWLFGGFVFLGAGYFNDLWKYNPATNQWTWESGSNTMGQLGTYGTLGIASATNRPGCRMTSTTWRDATGNLWLFGGTVSSIPVSGFFNDLWKYNPATNLWTWIKGSNTTGNKGTYGTVGVAAASNNPGSRATGAQWRDSAGNFWLFGGYCLLGLPSNDYPVERSDLWKYNPGTNEWTWITGDSSNYDPAVYGTMGVPAPANKPGARHFAASWGDGGGNFWCFGGNGFPSSAGGRLNDLWKLGNVPTPNLTINDVNHHEGNSGVATYSFKISLSSPAPAGGITFNITTANGSATAGSDYISKSLTSQTIAAGSSSYTFDVMVYGDTVFESNETFLVTVANVTGAIVTDSQGLGTLTNDDVSNSTLTTTTPWTWIKGDSTTQASGIYGSLGVPAPANKPGARWGSVSWTDPNGNFWLFGGYDFSGAYLNDLWKYDLVANQWTWVNGDNTPNTKGVSGILGVAAPSNKPGARYASVGWTDASGNLWLFGGSGYSTGSWVGKLNDLWKYNPATNQWTWVNGASDTYQPGVYGIQGTPGPDNRPGSREASVGWKDAVGNFWLFGGYGIANITSCLNDLWKYNPATNQWTWVKGSNAVDQVGVYGVLGTAAAGNTPGARQRSAAWTDATGTLWLFGGQYYSAGGNSVLLNDLWKYDPGINFWTCVNGSALTNQPGVYGVLGTANTTTSPGARSGGLTWTDDFGDLWLFGGFGYTANGSGNLNDLWKYNVTTGLWTWTKGANTLNKPGVYGTIGTANTANTPGGRTGNVSWADALGNLWLLGGSGFGYSTSINGYLNDLWKLGTSVTDPNISVCPGSNTNLTMPKPGNDYAYQWQVDSTGTGFVDLLANAVHSGVNMDTLQLYTPPTSYYGYKYRCIASKGASVIYGTVRTLKFGMTWQGSNSATWENPANWSCNTVPDENTDVIVRSNVPFSIQLSSNGVCHSLTLSPGATIKVLAGYRLDVKGR